jgi:hypothetical protein
MLALLTGTKSQYDFMSKVYDQYEADPHVRLKDPKIDCHVCGAYGHGYMLQDDIWAQVAPGEGGDSCLGEPEGDPRRGVLCLLCVEDKLGRTIRRSDFMDVAVNTPVVIAFSRSTEVHDFTSVTDAEFQALRFIESVLAKTSAYVETYFPGREVPRTTVSSYPSKCGTQSVHVACVDTDKGEVVVAVVTILCRDQGVTVFYSDRSPIL